MRKKIVGIVVVAVVAVVAILNVRADRNKLALSDLALENIDALAQDEATEKKFSYTVWETQECYILVGGAYAKGKKVSCYTGTDHPVCVDCKL